MSGFAEIFADLVQRHGGEAALSPTDLAIVRQLASVMAEPGDAVESAKVMVALQALLPSKPDEANETIDLSALSDDDLAELKRIVASCPRAPAKPEMQAAREVMEMQAAELERVRAERDRYEGDAAHFRAEHSRVAHELDHAQLELARGAPGRAADGDGEKPVPDMPREPRPPPGPERPSAEQPTNIVPMESREERIARLRREAGDRPQGLRAPFDNGLGGGGYPEGGVGSRFDNKVPLP